MAKLWEIVPNADDLLAFDPEELGGVLLQVIPGLVQNGMFQAADFDSLLFSHEPRYLPIKRKEIGQAISEAIGWLKASVLVVNAPSPNDTFLVLTRRGRSLIETDAYSQYRQASLLPKQLLHPVLAGKVRHAFLGGEWDTAVFQAFKEVEVSVRQAAGLSNSDLGVNLMAKAFNPDNGPLVDQSQERGERVALMELFRGSIGSYKNPHSHRNIGIDAEQAVEMIMLASHLLRIVDARRVSLEQQIAQRG